MHTDPAESGFWQCRTFGTYFVLLMLEILYSADA